MNTQVGTRDAYTSATAGTQVSCPWCAAGVASRLWLGEDEPVFIDHPLPEPRSRMRCPASGLTPSEVEPPAAPR